MKLQSGESVTIDIVGTARELFWGVVTQALQLAAFMLSATVAPVVLAALPLVLIAKNPNDDFSGLAQLFFWTAPLSCAFWTLVYSQWSSARAWQKMGRLHEWREDHGGLLVTVTKATAWMFLGLFGSFLCEIAFLIAFRRVPYAMFDGTARLRLWFALFPLACYFPLVPTWLWRRRHV